MIPPSTHHGHPLAEDATPNGFGVRAGTPNFGSVIVTWHQGRLTWKFVGCNHWAQGVPWCADGKASGLVMLVLMILWVKMVDG